MSGERSEFGLRDTFIHEIIEEDLKNGNHTNVVTRFPPEPNGYLHIGHAKSIVLNFELARQYDGQCHLRFDDTNPETESMEYVESIKEAVKWLGYDWGEHLYFASDYFDQFYEYAVRLVENGDAYVDSLDEETISEYRGSVNEPGKPSPYRDRSIEENLELFSAMKEGEFEQGEHVLRARIDMSSEHMIMRDPLLFRILHREHYRLDDEWCIYPMYDFAHPLEDAIEDVTHSLCTLEFNTNRVLYDWVLEHCLTEGEKEERPHQYEFSRLHLNFTVMSKSKLRYLIENGFVDGWDDPRLPTMMGLERRGVPATAVRSFCRDIGVSRTQGRVEISRFEHAIRDELEEKAPRVMGVVDPLRVVITNFPEDETDWIEAPHWPRNIDRSETRDLPFTKELYIDRDDFREDPPEGYHRLAPGREVRLRYGYFITCEDVVRNDDGEIVELRCSYDPDTRGGEAPNGRSPSGTIHWVSIPHALPAEIRSYDRLFRVSNPTEREEPFENYLNEHSLDVSTGYVEPSINDLPTDQRVQFVRVGYFWQDPEQSSADDLVLNQIVSLRDSWEEGGDQAKDMQQKRKEKQAWKQRQRRRSLEGERDMVEELDPDQKTRFEEYTTSHNVGREEAVVIARDPDLSVFFEEAVEDRPAHSEAIANWIVNDLKRECKEKTLEEIPITPAEFARLVELVEEGEISTRAADDVFETMVRTGEDPEDVVDERNLRKVGDEDELQPVIEEIIEQNPDQVEEFKQGKEGVIDYFVGQVMQKTGGSADPSLTKELLKNELA